MVKPYVASLWSAQSRTRACRRICSIRANLFFIGLLALCGANIATLVFARTATRDVEISVRTALGASRARIAGQLFAEALVLSSLAAAVGLAVGVLRTAVGEAHGHVGAGPAADVLVERSTLAGDVRLRRRAGGRRAR